MSRNTFGALNQQAIILAVQGVQADDAQLLNQLGLKNINESTAKRLKNLTIEHLNAACNYRGNFFDVLFDPRQLDLYLEYVETLTSEDQLINQVIKAGLRQGMLEELKGTSRREYAARRARMGLADHCKGRLDSLDEKDELAVLATWQKLSHVKDPLKKLVDLHQLTGISLDRAYATIKQFA